MVADVFQESSDFEGTIIRHDGILNTSVLG